MTDSPDDHAPDRFDRRAELYARFAVVPVAFSTNGRDDGFVGPLDIGIALGGR